MTRQAGRTQLQADVFLADGKSSIKQLKKLKTSVLKDAWGHIPSLRSQETWFTTLDSLKVAKGRPAEEHTGGTLMCLSLGGILSALNPLLSGSRSTGALSPRGRNLLVLL